MNSHESEWVTGLSNSLSKKLSNSFYPETKQFLEGETFAHTFEEKCIYL